MTPIFQLFRPKNPPGNTLLLVLLIENSMGSDQLSYQYCSHPAWNHHHLIAASLLLTGSPDSTLPAIAHMETRMILLETIKDHGTPLLKALSRSLSSQNSSWSHSRTSLHPLSLHSTTLTGPYADLASLITLLLPGPALWSLLQSFPHLKNCFSRYLLA